MIAAGLHGGGMSEAIETELRAAPAADIAEVLLIQVFALDALFRRAFKDARSRP